MQDLLKQRRLAGFVGRRAELALFEGNLSTSLEDPEHHFAFHVHGNAGVGKSFLVRRLVHTAKEAGALTAAVDESARSMPEVLEAVCAQFAAQGFPLKPLEKLLATYRQRRHEVEAAVSASTAGPDADPTTGAPAPTTGSLVVAQAGLIAMGLVPGAGALTGAIDPNRIAHATDNARAALSRHFGKQEDVALVLDPVKALTPVFLAELERIADRVPWIAFFFDTYERTSAFLDPWLCDLLASRHGPVPGNCLITTSGQRPLNLHVWSDHAGLITEIPLSPFTESEARQLLADKAVHDERVVRDVLRLSGCLPVLVSTLAENAGSTGAVDDPSATAVERFLKWEVDPVRRTAAQDGALPRRLNEDVFRAAVGTDHAPDLFAWLRSMPFVIDRGGRAQYHDVVREPMLRLRRNSSPERWSAGHDRLAAAFAGWCAKAGEGLRPAERWAQDSWRELRLEELYHRLCAQPRTALPAALRDGIDACDAGVPRARQWAQILIDAGLDANSDVLGSLGRESLGALEDDGRRCVELLGLILSRAELEPAAKVTALVVRGRDQRNLGDHGEAMRDYQRAIALDDACQRAHFGLGETHRLLHEHSASLEHFDRALELDAADSWALSSRAQSKHALGRSAEALLDLDDALESNPGHVWALVRRAQVRRGLGDGEGSLRDIRRARDLDADNPWIVGEYGEILRHLGRHEEAIALYDRALVLDPSYAWALGSRAMAKKALARIDDALADLTASLEIEPGYLWAVLRRAEIHGEQGDTTAEFADLDRVVETSRAKEWAHAQRGHAHLRAGRHEQAIADFDASLAHDPSYAYARVARGRARAGLQRYPEALSDLDQVLESAPGSTAALEARATVYRALGDHASELTDLEAAVAAAPQDPAYRVLRGDAHRRAGRHDRAIDDYDRAIALAPDDGWSRGRRGQSLHALDRWEEALGDLTRAAELHPDEPWIAIGRGRTLFALGRLTQAREELDRAIALAPDDARPYRVRARVHLAQGSPTLALLDVRALLLLGEGASARELLEDPALNDEQEADELRRQCVG
ncbi:tetratricopeptide repeat protein [Streptomyces sp. NPDC059076]|uniref:tetratricopeptide repeat protein n=1 Tax=unclassified Streptomyces TaxID=2593676 RepID=UPI0036837A26